MGQIAPQQSVALLAATGVLVTTVGKLEGLRPRAELLGRILQDDLGGAHGVPLGAFRAVLREVGRMPESLARAQPENGGADAVLVVEVGLGRGDAPVEMRHEARTLVGVHLAHRLDDGELVLVVEGLEALGRRQHGFAQRQGDLAPVVDGLGVLLRDPRLLEVVGAREGEGRVEDIVELSVLVDGQQRLQLVAVERLPLHATAILVDPLVHRGHHHARHRLVGDEAEGDTRGDLVGDGLDLGADRRRLRDHHAGGRQSHQRCANDGATDIVHRLLLPPAVPVF